MFKSISRLFQGYSNQEINQCFSSFPTVLYHQKPFQTKTKKNKRICQSAISSFEFTTYMKHICENWAHFKIKQY